MITVDFDTAKALHWLDKQVQAAFVADSSGHDIYHLKRVMNLALHIRKSEGGDEFVVAIAALLHDVHRIMQNESGKYCSPAESLPKIRDMLVRAGLSMEHERVQKVLHCIEFHEEYNFSDQGKSVSDIETMIVQDADNLDAIGAVGIARVFSFGGAHGIPIWLPQVPLDRESNWDETKPMSPSQIHHFHEKLLRLKDNMNTGTAKAMAVHRHKVMEEFLQELFCEWEGKA